MKLLAALAILALAWWARPRRRLPVLDDTDWTIGDPRLVELRGNGVRAR